jgi:hypothetical protein
MHMKHRGAGVIAIDGLLDLSIHAHRNVVRIGWQKLGAVGRDLDHQLFLVLGKQAVVEKMHE